MIGFGIANPTPKQLAACRIIYEMVCPDMCVTQDRHDQIVNELQTLFAWAAQQPADIHDAYSVAIKSTIELINSNVDRQNFASQAHHEYTTLPRP